MGTPGITLPRLAISWQPSTTGNWNAQIGRLSKSRFIQAGRRSALGCEANTLILNENEIIHLTAAI